MVSPRFILVLLLALVAGSLPSATSLAVPQPATCFGLAVTIAGTGGDDEITGTEQADVIDGKSGNDTIAGLGGNDTICGGNGMDIVEGGDGDDRIDGGNGKDILDGGNGNDVGFGGNGFDICSSVESGNGCEEGDGAITVEFSLPPGVSGTVELDGPSDRVAAAGASKTITMQADSGLYDVNTLPVVTDGIRYVGEPSDSTVTVQPGQTTVISVLYAPDGGALNLHGSDLQASQVTLSWDGPAGASYILRRASGDMAPPEPTAGDSIPISGTTATDAAIESGGRYSYSLFTQVDGSPLIGPLSVQLGTPSSDETVATYVSIATTLFAEPAEIISATTTGDGVDIVLADSVETRIVGSAVVLPISSTLEGGYLGVVESVDPIDRSIHLRPGALDDAFDYYELSIESYSSNEASVAAQTLVSSATSRMLEPTALPVVRRRAAFAPAGFSCEGGTVTPEILEFDPDIEVSGHFKTKIDKWGFIPKGATVDASFVVTATGAARVKTTVALKCDLTFIDEFETLTTSPIPISALLKVRARFETGGGVDVANVGITVTGGFEVDATMSAPSTLNVGADPILDASPLEPTLVGAHALIRARLGGFLTIGPGAGTKEAGVIVGIGGELYPLDASFAPYYDVTDPRHDLCTQIDARFSISAYLEARAWLSRWTFAASHTLWEGELFTYPGFPLSLPSGCENIPNDDTSLAVTQLLPPGVFPGQTFDYTVSVLNDGDATAREVSVGVELPTTGTFVSATSPVSPANPLSNSTATIQLPDIQAAATSSVTIKWRAPTYENIPLTFSATVTSANSDTSSSGESSVMTGVNGRCNPCGVTSGGTGLRNRSSGTIAITDLPDGATVTRAVLVWGILYNGTVPSNTITLNGANVSADLTSTVSGTLCWGDTATIGYAADVTDLVDSNGAYTVSEPVRGTTRPDSNPAGSLPYTDGASLVVFYNGGGANSQIMSDFTYNTSTDQSLSGRIVREFTELAATGLTSKMTLIGPDGQNNGGEQFTISGAGDPIVLTNTWDGSDPHDGPSFAIGNLWDTDVHDITSVLPAGQDSVRLDLVQPAGDCIGIAATVVEIPQIASP